MRYADGNESLPGDIVQIDGRYRGRVIACIDTQRYLAGHDGCAYLLRGIMVDTDFGGLVHYAPEASDELVLLQRDASA